MKSLLKLVTEFPLEDIQFPEKKVAEGETVVGVLPDELKRFWGVIMKIKKENAPKCRAHYTEAERLEKEFFDKHSTTEGGHDHSLCPEQIEAILAEKQKGNDINDEFVNILEIFWGLVRFEFNLKDSNIGIRDGGQIITFKKNGSEEEMNFSELGELLDALSASFRPSAFDRRPMMRRNPGIGDFLKSVFGGR